jgi:aldehyde:ferredoxin oxidoreductase
MRYRTPKRKPVSIIGSFFDRAKYTSMLKEYYPLRGWDEKTGVPPNETLASLG